MDLKSTRQPELYNPVIDTRPFLPSYKSIIFVKRAPLQAHHSAMIFSLVGSVIQKFFVQSGDKNNSISNRIKITPKIDDWD